MKQGVGTVLSKDNFYPPRHFKPEIIINLAISPRFSTLDYARFYPEAKIFSVQFDLQNFLYDANRLAYHDNIEYVSWDLNKFILDEFIWSMNIEDKDIDFIRFDVRGAEKSIFKLGGDWPEKTAYLKARLADYNYEEAKRDVSNLGFNSWASYDGYDMFVIGENKKYSTSITY